MAASAVLLALDDDRGLADLRNGATSPLSRDRRRVAQYLGEARAEAGIPLLETLLDDSHLEVRAAAVEALGKLASPTSVPLDYRTTRLRNLQERLERLDEIVRRIQAQYDLETRVEEKMRLEPLIREKQRDRDQAEAELRQHEARDSPAPDPPRLFYSYAHEDEPLRDKLARHLSLLERRSVLSSWHDRNLAPGTPRNQEISRHLLEADLILLLISADFLASDYIWGRELEVALERHERGEARVIPVILRPTDWADAPFSHLEPLPRDGRPVTSWPDRDEAFASIASALREVASEIGAGRHRVV